jgi:hypothetical protein
LKSGKNLNQNIAQQFINSIFCSGNRKENEDDNCYTLKEMFMSKKRSRSRSIEIRSRSNSREKSKRHKKSRFEEENTNINSVPITKNTSRGKIIVNENINNYISLIRILTIY